jgi:hypothetical protein
VLLVLVPKVLLAFREHKVLRVIKVARVLKVSKEDKVLLVLKEPRVLPHQHHNSLQLELELVQQQLSL